LFRDINHSYIYLSKITQIYSLQGLYYPKIDRVVKIKQFFAPFMHSTIPVVREDLFYIFAANVHI
jgi:hypothetical protein